MSDFLNGRHLFPQTKTLVRNISHIYCTLYVQVFTGIQISNCFWKYVGNTPHSRYKEYHCTYGFQKGIECCPWCIFVLVFICFHRLYLIKKNNKQHNYQKDKSIIIIITFCYFSIIALRLFLEWYYHTAIVNKLETKYRESERVPYVPPHICLHGTCFYFILSL